VNYTVTAEDGSAEGVCGNGSCSAGNTNNKRYDQSRDTAINRELAVGIGRKRLRCVPQYYRRTTTPTTSGVSGILQTYTGLSNGTLYYIWAPYPYIVERSVAKAGISLQDSTNAACCRSRRPIRRRAGSIAVHIVGACARCRLPIRG